MKHLTDNEQTILELATAALTDEHASPTSRALANAVKRYMTGVGSQRASSEHAVESSNWPR